MKTYVAPFDEVMEKGTTIVILGDWPRLIDGEEIPIKRFTHSRHDGPVVLQELIDGLITGLHDYLITPIDLVIERLIETEAGLLIIYEGMPPKYLPESAGETTMDQLKTLIRALVIRLLARIVVDDVVANGLTAADEATVQAAIDATP